MALSGEPWLSKRHWRTADSSAQRWSDDGWWTEVPWNRGWWTGKQWTPLPVDTPPEEPLAEQWWPQKGWTSLLVHNYGGRRRKKYLNEAIRDLLVNFPAHIMVLQEHASGQILLEEDHEDFHILEHEHNGAKTGLAIMARKRHSFFYENCVDAVFVLDSGQIVANVRKKTSSSPAVVYELDLPHGTKLRILNTHFHHETAKKAKVMRWLMPRFLICMPP